MGGRERHVVGHYRLRQPFQRERADFFERYGLLDRDGYSLSDKDLTVRGLSAKTRGEIANGADRGIAGALCKADLTERRVPLSDPSTKPEQSATSTPAGDQCARGLAHRHRHLDGARGRFWDRHRVVEENHDSIAGELVERSLELADQRPQRAVIFAQKIEHFLGFGGLGESGVAAQIAEHDNDLAAMAFEDFLVAVRDDQFGQLRRQEPSTARSAPVPRLVRRPALRDRGSIPPLRQSAAAIRRAAARPPLR